MKKRITLTIVICLIAMVCRLDAQQTSTKNYEYTASLGGTVAGTLTLGIKESNKSTTINSHLNISLP